MKDTCLIITTFLRDKCLFRCIESIRKYYPEIAIFIGDNGEPNKEKKKFCQQQRCKLFELSFDLGVSGVRNESLKLMPKKYKYIIICEDDIIFTEGTKLENWRKILDRKEDIGIIGGLLKTDDVKEQHYEANTKIENDTHYIEKIGYPDWKKLEKMRYFLCDLILNVFMMRRAVWEDCQWDNQFKTAFEHSDFFLRIKHDTPWRVAYTPDVWMYHLKDMVTDTGYAKYRRRPVGWSLFGKKWKVKYCMSSYNKTNPIVFDSMFPNYNMKDENLELAINILNKHKCKWWLTMGTCLGAIRDGDFIAGDPDIDIGLDERHVRLWKTFIKEFQEAGFSPYKEWTHKDKKIELSFKRKAVKLDLFFFYRKGKSYWHGIFGPDDKGRWGKNMIFMPNIFSGTLFSNLKEIFFRGKRCFVPFPVEQYLAERYGEGWKKPDPNYRYWKDCKAINRIFFENNKTVFIGDTWDLFNASHLDNLRLAKMIGEKLIVGVLTDEAARKAALKITTPFQQRKQIIEALKIVDQVITQNAVDPTKDFESLRIRPAHLVYNNEQKSHLGKEYVESYGGKVIVLPPERQVNSPKVEKMPQVKSETKKVKTDSPKIAIGIKTFLREKSLFKALDAIEKNFPFPYRLYIADDGKISDEKEYRYQRLENQGHLIIRGGREIGFNSGISVGRNTIVKRSTEKHILIMDDDMAIVEGDAVKKMKDVLDGNENIGICSGMLYSEAGGFQTCENYQKGLDIEIDRGMLIRQPNEKEIQKAYNSLFLYAEQVSNFFLAKREVFDDIRWDDRIKVGWEHLDFFLQLKKTNWKVAACLGTRVVHMNSENDPNYNQQRWSVSNDYFYSKHKIHRVLNRFN